MSFSASVVLPLGKSPLYSLEREREREKKVGGVVRDTTVLEGGVTET
jgi:hypothetical protein